jgi:hypothetical protein
MHGTNRNAKWRCDWAALFHGVMETPLRSTWHARAGVPWWSIFSAWVGWEIALGGRRPALGCGAIGLARASRPFRGTWWDGLQRQSVGDLWKLSRDHGSDRCGTTSRLWSLGEFGVVVAVCWALLECF